LCEDVFSDGGEEPKRAVARFGFRLDAISRAI
jgi:hypothetical protein